MKLANLGGRAVLMVTDTEAFDVATASAGRFGPALPAVYADWTEFARWASFWLGGSGRDSGETVAVDAHRLRAPSPEARQVFGIGLNYRAHAEESGRDLPAKPATFTKFPGSITGPFAEVELPEGGSTDWEVELVVVMGQRAHRVAAADAWSHVAGLTVGQDLSERNLQFAAGMQFSLGKSYPGFGPIGPWLVSPDEFDDPDDLELWCSVDGVEMQRSRTSDLIFTVPALIEELSAVLALCPGDLIFTGTPAGVGMARQPPTFLQPGQVVVSGIEGIGEIVTRFR